ncbi:MAG: glycosyltransferase family 4 protein [Caldilineaceae bacterium]|nr:glycosyltransferase family 4 protein [Caldilineaceae bacterium]
MHALARLNVDDEFLVFQHRKHRTPLLDHAGFRRVTLYSPVHTRAEQFSLPVELLRFRLDLLHSTDFIPPLYSHLPTVITVHDLAFLHWPHFVTADGAAYYGQIDRGVRHARHVIVPSESTKRDLIAQLGVPASKVSVIYEAADESFAPLEIEATRVAVQRKYGLPERYILFVGTIEPRKNIAGLLAAFRYLRDVYHLTDLGLAIVGGQGWLYEETLAMIEEWQLQNQVYLLGRVADDDLHRLYVGAACHAHPAHYEGFGLPPLEAMACGTPTVVSNISSLPEVVGDSALLVDPNEPEELAIALHRLLTDADLWQEMREKGLRRAAFFSWDQAARKTMEVYRSVADDRELSPAQPHTSSNQTNPP